MQEALCARDRPIRNARCLGQWVFRSAPLLAHRTWGRIVMRTNVYLESAANVKEGLKATPANDNPVPRSRPGFRIMAWR